MQIVSAPNGRLSMPSLRQDWASTGERGVYRHRNAMNSANATNLCSGLMSLYSWQATGSRRHRHATLALRSRRLRGSP